MPARDIYTYTWCIKSSLFISLYEGDKKWGVKYSKLPETCKWEIICISSALVTSIYNVLHWNSPSILNVRWGDVGIVHFQGYFYAMTVSMRSTGRSLLKRKNYMAWIVLIFEYAVRSITTSMIQSSLPQLYVHLSNTCCDIYLFVYKYPFSVSLLYLISYPQSTLVPTRRFIYTIQVWTLFLYQMLGGKGLLWFWMV